MAFPTSLLPLVTEVLIDGTWTDVTSRRRIASGLTITRGRGDWSSRPAPSRGDCVFNNADAYFSNRRADSANFGLLGRNTQLRHRIRWVCDTFTRTESSSWGTSDTGQGWTNTGGSASDFSVGGSGQGKHTMTSVNVFRTSTVTLPAGTPDVTVKVNSSAVATGAAITPRCFVGTDANNLYEAQLSLKTDSNVELTLSKRVSGVDLVLVAATLVGTYAVGVNWSVRLQKTPYGIVRTKAWKPSTESEPTTWTLATTTPDTAVTTYTIAGVRSRLETGNTNTDPVLSYDNFEANDYRFWGETSAFAPAWNIAETDVTAPVEVAGILRRLGSGARPLRSALFRTMAGISPGDYVPHVYWSMEDASDATRFASATTNGSPILFGTGVTPANDDTLAGSDALATLDAGTVVSFTIPDYTNQGQCANQWAMKIGSEPAAEMTLAEFTAASGPVRLWRITCAPGSPSEIRLHEYDATGASLGSVNYALDGSSPNSRPSEADFYGHWAVYTLAPSQDGGDVTAWFGFTVTPEVGGVTGGSTNAGTLGVITGGRLHGGESGTSVGHLVVYTDPAFSPSTDAINNTAAMNGWAGELAADRLIRLCHEEGIYFELCGDAADTAAMGAQRVATFLDNVYDCEDADRGNVYEPRDALGLGYRARVSLYNQNQTGPSLDYAGGIITSPFQPTEDDQLTSNDVTVGRFGGSSVRVVVEDGPLSVDSVGTYEESATVNVETDDQLRPLAGWLAHLGSWDEARFSTVTVNLAAPDVAASPSLLGSVPALTLGSYFSVANPPAWLPPENVGLLIQGVTEFIGDGHQWSIIWNTVPAGPYIVFELDHANQGRLEGDHALASSVTTSATSWSVATLSGPVLTDVDAQDGMQWMCEGELVIVTDISGTSSPQTCTVTRNVNGIPGGKAHSADAVIRLYPAPHLAL